MSEREEITLDDVERRMIEAHRQPYYDWTKLMVSLSSGSLTLLISLQGFYLPKASEHILLLQLCWIALSVAILTGLLVLYGEHRTPVEAVNELRKIRQKDGDRAAVQMLMRRSGKSPRKIFALSHLMMTLSFTVATVALAWFAVLNLPSKARELEVSQPVPVKGE